MSGPNLQLPQTKEEHDKESNLEREFKHTQRWHALNEILKLFSTAGEYAICRKDGQPLGLGDIMGIGDIFEKAEKSLTQ